MIDRMQFVPRCPTCGRAANVDADNLFLPFCSERCRLIDLGRWLNEEHSVPCEAKNEDEQENPSTTRLPPGWDDP